MLGLGLGIWLTLGRESTETCMSVFAYSDNVLGLLIIPALICSGEI